MCTKLRRIFTEQVCNAQPHLTDVDVDMKIKTYFADWFSQNVSN